MCAQPLDRVAPIRTVAPVLVFALVFVALPTPGRAQARLSVPSLSQQATATATADSVSNGIAIGAAVGGGAALGMLAIAYARCDEGCEAPSAGPMAAISLAMGAGGGALTGWLIDRARKNRPAAAAAGQGFAVGTRTRVDVAPVLTRRQRSVRVVVRF